MELEMEILHILNQTVIPGTMLKINMGTKDYSDDIVLWLAENNIPCCYQAIGSFYTHGTMHWEPIPANPEQDVSVSDMNIIFKEHSSAVLFKTVWGGK